MKWTKPLVHGDLPVKRSYHTLSLIGEKIYLFGGYCKASNTTLNDLHVLDTSMRVKT